MQHKTQLQADYEGLIPTIQRLSLAAQFISGSTAAVGIFIVILEKMPITIKLLAIALAVVLTIIIIGSFEGGIRTIFPYWIRQILNWSFGETEEERKPRSIRVILFTMISILLLPLILGTTLSSWKASPDLVDYTSTAPNTKDLETLANNLDNNALQFAQQFNQDLARDSTLFTQKINAEQAKWQAKIEAQEIQRKKYLRLYEQGHSWAGGSAAKIKNKIIPNLKISMQEALNEIQLQRSEALNKLRGLKSTTLLREQQSKLNILSTTQLQNDSLLLIEKEKRQKWGNFLALLAIIATFFTLFCFVFIEAYFAGILPQLDSFTSPDDETQNVIDINRSKTQTQAETLVPQGVSQNSTHNLAELRDTDFNLVFIDKLIKRTRMQWKRSQDESKSLESRTTNRKKAEENMVFLKSIGIEVEIDQVIPAKLNVKKKSLA